mmetsp:Transcript_12241/g.18963  ORF Transcript_12241/g.18963 Transcript_12241/m.18963 type:complete len:106 (+) Transcript_12241:2201-2518(+)
MENLVNKRQYHCYRCFQKGATAQCWKCNRALHGFNCQRLYLLQIDDTQINYQCLFCQNLKNVRSTKPGEMADFKNDELNDIRKNISKDHLIESKPYANSRLFYVP